MSMRLPRLVAACALMFGAGCAVPGLGGPGGGPLVFDVLALTRLDAETGNIAYKVNLRWTTPPNARLFEVVRKFGDQPAGVKASQASPNWVDETMGPGQQATYTLRVLNGESKVLTVSDDKPVTVLKNEVGKPAGLKPADNARVGVGETPMLSWEPVANASWYYVRVTREDNNNQVYAALTRNTSVKLGEASPLKLDKWDDLFPVGGDASLARGVVHKWTVSALRGNGPDDPNKVSALDVTPSANQVFSVGN